MRVATYQEGHSLRQNVTVYSLEGNNRVLALLVTTNFEALAAADNLETLVRANGAFQTEDNLLGSLGL